MVKKHNTWCNGSWLYCVLRGRGFDRYYLRPDYSKIFGGLPGCHMVDSYWAMCQSMVGHSFN